VQLSAGVQGVLAAAEREHRTDKRTQRMKNEVVRIFGGVSKSLAGVSFVSGK
jgi:hypothetical protein